jgi:DNA ligase-1
MKLGRSSKTLEKMEALTEYFTVADNRDKVWVIALFSGRRPKRILNASYLRLWCQELTALPEWLFEESYHTVGDLAETISLLLPAREEEDENLETLSFFLRKIIALEKQPDPVKKEFVTETWKRMTRDEIFVFNKLLTGNFRIGVSQKTIVNALSKLVNLEPSVIAHRVSGRWDPETTGFEELLSEESSLADLSKPYPFFLAYALSGNVEDLGDEKEWQAEWKWDGIRGQLIKREGEIFVWSRGEELMTEKFPEYFSLKQVLPDGLVLDGEIIPSIENKPLPFALLQTRIGRKNITKKNLQEVPIAFFCYDIMEYGGQDIRSEPLRRRREVLEEILAQAEHPSLLISPLIYFDNWEQLKALREDSRVMGAEGLMLKRLSSEYQVGRKTGDWWKWKIDPLVIDAVMIYAQKGHGRRSNLYTDYTFAVKDGDKLVSFAKAYSGLTDREIAQVDAFVRKNSIEKFGPVRTVKPELVFEIAFEGIAASNRHKSGVALRFPRINRWRHDKKAEEINTLADLKKMLEVYGK